MNVENIYDMHEKQDWNRMKTLYLWSVLLFSNLGIALLGQVLGDRFGNGAGYEGWIKRNLFDIFEMTDTSFVLDDR